MKPDISELSVEDLKRLQLEAEALIASKKDHHGNEIAVKWQRVCHKKRRPTRIVYRANSL